MLPTRLPVPSGLVRRSAMVLMLLLAMLTAVPAIQPAPVAHAATTTIVHLQIVSARTVNTASNIPFQVHINKGDDLCTPASCNTPYKWLIVKDDTGNPTQPAMPNCTAQSLGGDPNYPANCNWSSIRSVPGGVGDQSNIVAQGDNSQINEGTAGIDLSVANANCTTANPCKYMVSVLSHCPYTSGATNPTPPCDGFKISGAWFSVPLANPGPDPGLVTVKVEPNPLPLATVKVHVFNDINGTNGEFDTPGEPGLAGFQVHISDVLNEVTNDWFNNPLCTKYQRDSSGKILFAADGRPIPIAGSGGRCITDANGDVSIENLGTDRYSVTVVPPNGSNWIQTSTLEGNHDWDTWPMEGATGVDTENLAAGEPESEVNIGFVQPQDTLTNPAKLTGELKLTAIGLHSYSPPASGTAFGGEAGNSVSAPVANPWIAIASLQANDVTTYVAQGDVNGNIDVKGIPNGDYEIAVWDQPQDFLVETGQITIKNGQLTNLGSYYLAYWFSDVHGRVCIDTNGNGKCDAGEQGVANQDVMLKSRDNSLQDQGTARVKTDANGYYDLHEAYPLGQWVVQEVQNDRFQTSGVTYKTNNQPNETTIPGNGIDVSTFNLVSLDTRVDWALKPIPGNQNGGIYGSVIYDTTRNELDARQSLTEDYEGMIPGVTVNLYAPVACGTHTGVACDAAKNYELSANGSYAKLSDSHGNPVVLNSYVSDTWKRPTNCVARDVNGSPVQQQFLPPSTGGHDCLEAPLMANQVDNQFSLVNGNYAFATIKADPVTGAAIPEKTMPAGDYLVEVQIPKDNYGASRYQVTSEADININTGDTFIPQVPPPPCAGPLQKVNVQGAPGSDASSPAVYNPAFAAAGGSPYQGKLMPLCSAKLVTVASGRASPNFFNLFTEVPVPGRWFGLITDDLNLSTNQKELMYGEKIGIPNIPVGIYDFSGQLVTTAQTDPNGEFEVLLPSTSSFNCPLPAGPCPNVLRMVANDPGSAGHPNPNFNAGYRSLGVNFQVWPNLTTVVDAAPVPVAAAVEGPGVQTSHTAICTLDPATPQIFAVSPKPYLTAADVGSVLTINGLGFGASQGSGKVNLDGYTHPKVKSWSDRQIQVIVPALTVVGPHKLSVLAGNGQTTVNDLTLQIIGSTYTPTIFEVGPGKTYATIQGALDAAASAAQALVVVYPPDLSTVGPNDPTGAYRENIVMHSAVKLQGVGPGGVYADGTFVPGSVIDGAFFEPTNAAAWRTLVGGLHWDGNQTVYEGATATIFAKAGQFTAAYNAAIDGFTIQGGNQIDFPGNLNDNGGGPVPNPVGDVNGEVAVTQGGGIFANAYASYLQITNNVIKGNGGTYAGAIRIGTPYVGDNHNDHVLIGNNRILNNGGTNLAGAVGLFTGSSNYHVTHNDICGNFSAEYGGGISAIGLSPNSQIDRNRIYFNAAYDEGAGVLIGGEQPQTPATNPNQLSAGSGPVNIFNNLIQGNTAGDDGGGMRFLMAGNWYIHVYNNFIVNNISAHEGGGVALDDSTKVRFFNNTVMKNITTATARTSNGQPAPAGLSDTGNSVQLQATLPKSSATTSNPLLFNNIFWDNRAGTWNTLTGALTGIGLTGDPNPINHWDIGLADGSGVISPTNSLLQVCDPSTGCTPDPSNVVGQDPKVISTYDVSVNPLPWRGDPHFVGTTTIAVDLPPNLLGNYRLQAGSPANNIGAVSKAPISAPKFDYDSTPRPGDSGYEAGAYEYPVPFPTSAPLDSFDRATGPINVDPTNPMWSDPTNAFGVLQTDATAGTGVATVQNSAGGGAMVWNPTDGSGLFDVGEEAYFTYKQIPTQGVQSLLLKVCTTAQGCTTNHMIVVSYNSATRQLYASVSAPSWAGFTGAANPPLVQAGSTTTVTTGNRFVANDVFGARISSTGSLTIYRNGALVKTVNLSAAASSWWTANGVGTPGNVGVMFAGPNVPQAQFDDFGGGSLP